jgi:hypothetical protein
MKGRLEPEFFGTFNGIRMGFHGIFYGISWDNHGI